jgi:triosephosphate isomerase (TIM)
MKPIVVINFKTYVEGKAAAELAKKIEKFDKDIIIGVSTTDIYRVRRLTKLKVFAEHVDGFEKGRATGFIMPEAVKAAGAKGVFLNHSEHKISFKELSETVKRCKKIGLEVLIFASSLSEAKRVKGLRPDYLAYEPPELVGGDISVSTAKPEMIKKISKELGKSFLVGAGVKNKQDVEIAVKLGASGIAVSSGIVCAKKPEKVLMEMLG